LNNIIDTFGYSKMCAGWAARSVTEYNRIVREKFFFPDFLSYKAGGARYLSRIVTGDE
jgi:hypothetical protein